MEKVKPVPDYLSTANDEARKLHAARSAAWDTQKGIAHRYKCSASADVVQELDLQCDRLTHRGAQRATSAPPYEGKEVLPGPNGGE